MSVAPRSRSRRVGTAVGVVLLIALIALAVAAVWGGQRSGDEVEPVAEPLPLVVLVSGYGGDGQDTEPLAVALRAGGRDVAVFPPVGDNTGDLEEQARLLGEFISTEILDTERGDTQSVDVIGFSAGGVVARLWSRDFGGQDVARRILTIAAPHHGTRLAGLADLGGFCEGACAQLVPGNALLERLNEGDETPGDTEWITIWSETDRTVSPAETASLEGSLGFTVQSVCPDSRAGHLQLPDSPVVTTALKTTLGSTAPEAPKPADVDCQN